MFSFLVTPMGRRLESSCSSSSSSRQPIASEASPEPLSPEPRYISIKELGNVILQGSKSYRNLQKVTETYKK